MQINNVYVSYYRQQEQVFFCDKSQARNMKKHADRNRLAGDILLQKGQEFFREGREEDARDAYSSAGHSYIKSCEKTQKAALVASGYSKNTIEDGKRNLFTSHNNKELASYLAQKDAEVISIEEANRVDHICQKKGLSYVALEYGNGIYIDEKQCSELKAIAEKAHNNYQKKVEREQTKMMLRDVVDDAYKMMDDNY